MHLSVEALRSFVSGAVSVEERAEGVVFHRFLEAERECYRANPDFYAKTRSGSGITLHFITDARRISFDATLTAASSRRWGFFDLTVDGLLVGHTGSADIGASPDVRFEYALDGGRHRCTLYLPQLACAALRNVEFAGATYAEARRHRRRMLFYGDSITQGYDAQYPALTYDARVAAAVEAEVRNKAIGGDTYRPELLAAPQPGWIPDLIVVAYGTNDWNRCPGEVFRRKSAEFYEGLARIYPGVPVAALQPIWRADGDRCTATGEFAEAGRIIAEAAKRDPAAVVIRGLDFVPPIPDFFADRRLHPNDLGFCFYAGNLLRELFDAKLLR